MGLGNTVAFQVLANGLFSLVDRFRFFLKIAFPWMLILLPVFCFCKEYLLLHPLDESAAVPDWIAILASVVPITILSFAMCSIAVRWHRMILDQNNSNYPNPIILLDGTVFRYWWIALLVTLIAIIVFVPLFFGAMFLFGLESTLGLILVILIGFLGNVATLSHSISPIYEVACRSNSKI